MSIQFVGVLIMLIPDKIALSQAEENPEQTEQKQDEDDPDELNADPMHLKPWYIRQHLMCISGSTHTL